MGSGNGNDRAQTFHHGHWYEGLFLRSPPAMAARILRKCERAIEAVFAPGNDLSVYAQAELNAVARRLKERLRKTLDYETPAELFPQTIASTSSICHRTEAPKVTWSFPVRRETCLFDTASGRSILNITASYFRPPSGIRNTVGCGRREWRAAPRGSQSLD